MRAFVTDWAWAAVGMAHTSTHNVPIIRTVKTFFLCSRLVKGLDGFLERDRDRENVFDLAPIEKSPETLADGL